MTQIPFKIENLLPASFYGRGLPFPEVPKKGAGTAIGENFENLPENERSWPNSYGLNQYSALGTKFYLPVGFKIEGKLYQLPWEPSMTITGQKIIVKTQMAGNTRRGSVKELINTDDYIITLQGICLDHARKNYPFDQVDIIRTIFEYEGSIEIVSALTDLYNIKNVAVKSHSLPSHEGRPYSQPYTIELESDEDFILILD
jgi:hypothetical protein